MKPNQDKINQATVKGSADVAFSLIDTMQKYLRSESKRTEGEQMMGVAAFFVLWADHFDLDREILVKAARLMRTADGTGYVTEFRAIQDYLTNEVPTR